MNKEEQFEDFIFRLALENAVEHSNDAQAKPLIGKAVQQFPDIKQDMQHYLNSIENIVQQVNLLSHDERRKKLNEINPKFFEKKEKKEETPKIPLPELPGLDKPMRVRTEPAPSGYLHIGHAFNIVYNYAYTHYYGGEFILRFADTNPENVKKENYEPVLADIDWLTDGNVDEVYYQSDRLPIYYEYLQKLIDSGHAYVCECSSEDFTAYKNASAPCPHRELPNEEQQRRFSRFMNRGYEDKQAVIRFAADLSHKNPALRDFGIARLNSSPHPRMQSTVQVWPMMDLSVAIDDVLMKLTHVIRGKDHEMNMEKQKMIHAALGMESPVYFHLGRTRFDDITLSKTELSESIANGTYWGWDDPRVPSLISYRRRGYEAEAFRSMVIANGMSKRDSRISEKEFLKSLDYYNRQILEKTAHRAFFLHAPKSFQIKNISEVQEKAINIAKHPDHKEWGYRHFQLKKELFIDQYDFDSLEEGDMVRLMYCGNFEIDEKHEHGVNVRFHSGAYDKQLPIKGNIHFLPELHEPCRLILSDATELQGYCEPLGNPREGEVLQFERFGFVKYEGRFEHTHQFLFTHR